MDLRVTLFDKELADRLLQSIQTPGFLAPTFEMIGAQLNTDLADYPPPPPDSSYRRTNTLGRNWTHEETVGLMSIQTTLGNVTPYARFVQDPEEQAWMHKDRWQTTKDVLERREQWITNLILAAIQSHVASLR